MPPARNTEFHIDPDGYPIAGSRWRHHSGRVYIILMITNRDSTNPEKFPVTAVYQGQNGARWSRPVSAFIMDDKFTPEA